MNSGLIIPLAGIMLPVVLVPIIIAMTSRMKKREWQHKERLRAIELGMPASAPHQSLGGGTVTMIGAGVPAASVLSALLFTMNLSEGHPDYMPILAVVWGFAFMISIAALI